MGSALTIILSVARLLNISLIFSLFVTHCMKLNFPSSMLVVIFFSIITYISFNSNLFGHKFDPLNHFSTPLPSIIEIILPIILLLYLLYENNYDIGLIGILLLYGLMIYNSLLFPLKGGIDKRAANKFWENPFL